jgi:ribosomal protein S18 acetylase RimI-like enzyme
MSQEKPTIESLTMATDNNIACFFRTLAIWPKISISQTDELLSISSDIPFPLFNSIMSSYSCENNLQSIISKVTDKADKNAVPLMWWVSPISKPANIESQLINNNFEQMDITPAMHLDLSANLTQKHIDGLVIKKVACNETLRHWCDTLIAGYELPEFAGDAFYEFNLALRFDNNPPLVNYIAYLDGKPVATSSVFYGGGVAAIYNVATLPTARGKGIGTAVTIQPLIDTKVNTHYKHAVLLSSDMGKSVYETIGFKSFCNMSQYYYAPKENKATKVA